ncbi:MAG: FAD-dependent oxidoreductase, partial [Sutterella wadsworthensis]
MITRRQLFAGILGLTAGPSWCQPQETLAAADVIVVGAGLAGLSAAVSAREAGARRVLILEKDVMIGGHSIMSSGYFNAVDPKRQKPLGITDSPALMEKQSLQVGGDTASPILMRQL